MLAVLLLLAGIVGGYVVYHRKKKNDNPYSMSAGAAWVLYIALGAAASFGAVLVPNVLPNNANTAETFHLLPSTRLVNDKSETYYVLENYTESGRPVHSWIVDIDGETVLRSDFALDPARIIVGGDKAEITYVTPQSYYPLISPLRVRTGLFEVTVRVPDNSVYQNFHLTDKG